MDIFGQSIVSYCVYSKMRVVMLLVYFIDNWNNTSVMTENIFTDITHVVMMLPHKSDIEISNASHLGLLILLMTTVDTK